MISSTNSFTFKEYPRIAVDPQICMGKPHVKGTRITVSSILAHLAGGMSIAEMLQEFPRLKEEDIYQALGFASGQLLDVYFPLEMAA